MTPLRRRMVDAMQVRGLARRTQRERHLARSSVNQAGCAFRFLYHTVLERREQVQVPLARAEQRLPQLLSREELARLFACAREGKPRTALMTAYALGLRAGELCHLRVGDIDSHGDRMCVRVVQGKGAKDRYVPLPPDLLEQLRVWWKLTRPSGRNRQSFALSPAGFAWSIPTS